VKTIAAPHRHVRPHRSSSAAITASFTAPAGRRSAVLAAAACCLSLAGSALAAETAKPTHSVAQPAIEIPMRSFSANPTVGGTAASVADPSSPKYGAIQVFIDKAAAYSKGRVKFSVASWNPSEPHSVIEQVGIEGDQQDAAYDTGGALNPTWGLFYLSMAPFHLSHEQTIDWLYRGGGLALAQSLLDARKLNVQAIPMLSSNPQIAGHFKAPIGSVECDGEPACQGIAPLGLAGLCSAGWTLRFLPPGQLILDRACDTLAKEGSIPEKKLTFVNAISGLSNLAAIQSGAVTGFEQATPMDDLSLFYAAQGAPPVPQAQQNPGQKGLRFLHFPSWHQPFLLGFVLLNQKTIWNRLSPADRKAIERAGRDAVTESYAQSASAQCGKLRALLEVNDRSPQLKPDGTPLLDAKAQPIPADLHLAQWGDGALQKLQEATEQYLQSLRGGAEPSPEQREFRRVHDSILAYERRIHFAWKPTAFPAKCDLPSRTPVAAK
jgi:TRAP-type mannitol/chloroaromatic compound transport system substrate-binding protein